MKREYWALLVFVLIIVLQWIGLGFHGQIRFIFLSVIYIKCIQKHAHSFKVVYKS